MRWMTVGLGCVVLAVGVCRGDEEEAVEEQVAAGREPLLVKAWAEKLSARYFEGGDRVLVYEATKPGKPSMRFEVAVCESKHLGAVRVGEAEAVRQAMGWFPIEAGGPPCAHVWSGDGEVFRVEGIDRLFAELGELEKLMGGDGVVGNGGLDCSFYLSEQRIVFTMGAGLSANDRRAPWLKPDVLARATDVEVGEQEVVFVLPEGGKLVVRTDGVLQRQEFPVGGVERVLRLVSVEKMEAWSVEKHFAKFDPEKVRVEQIEGGPQAIGLMQRFCLAMVRKLASMENAADKLDERKGELVEKMVEMYRPMARRAVAGDAKLKKAREGMTDLIRHAWMKARTDMPEQTRNTTYAQFLEAIRKPFQEQVLRAPMDGLDKVLPPILDPEVRAGLTGKELAVADQFRDFGGEAFSRAMMLELLEAAIDGERKAALE